MKFDFEKQAQDKSNEELLQIYHDFDEYQDEYLEIVLKELDRRGVDLSHLKLRKQHKEAFMSEQLEKGKPGDPIYITIGFVSALFGGLIGIIAGYVYSQSKNKDWGDGTFYYYDLKTRNLGIGMMVLGIFILIVSLVYKLT
jgi:hypothetical protein